MLAVQLEDRDLVDTSSEYDETRRLRFDFPISSLVGAASTSVVYFELEPGEHTGMHTDSAEEIVLILSGTVEASLGEETGRLTAGQAVLIPAMVPHGIRNIGQETARCVGFFSAATVESTFDQPMMPFGQPVVGTPPVESTV